MKSPIFIVGCDRSGTTLLRLILNNHPSLHIPSESGFLPHLSNRESAYGDFTQPHQRWFFIRDLQINKATSRGNSFPIFNLTLEEAESALCKAAPTNYLGASAALFSASAQKHGKYNWGDKTPQHVFHIPWLAGAFPDAKFVHVIRDGRDVATSIIQLGWQSSFLKAADYWQERVHAGISSGAILGTERYYELRYEQLITNPEETVQDLCLWLGLDFLPQMLAQHDTASNNVDDWKGHEMVKRPIDASKIATWKHSLSRQQIADFESVAGKLLAQLGYEVTGTQVSWWLQIARATLNSLKPLFEKALTLSKRVVVRSLY